MPLAAEAAGRRKPAMRMYVDGRWTDASSGKTYRVLNPATEETVADVPDASRAHVQSAAKAARRPFDEGPWRRTTAVDRRKVLLQIAEELERRKEEVRELLCSRTGGMQEYTETQCIAWTS